MIYRSEIKHKPKRVVLKIGSSGLTQKEGGIDIKQVRKIARDLALLHEEKIELIVVSSGAVSTGKGSLKNPNTKHNISDAQAAAAIGQPILMHQYKKELDKHNIVCAQVLLTHEDLKNQKRYLNARNTLLKLISSRVIPILNENDSVSFEEITMGDNDQLAAMVAVMLEADLLILLTQTDGLYDKDPSQIDAHQIKHVPFNDALKDIRTKSKTKVGTGGMEAKLMAVKKFSELGGKVIIGTHQKTKPILRVLTSEHGTYFSPNIVRSIKAKKNWIFSTSKSLSQIIIDDGAHAALLKNGSLLPIGVTSVKGKFKRGDSVEIYNKGKLIGIGLSEYSSEEVDLIKKQKSNQIKKILGHENSQVIIHRDNLFIKKV